MNVLFRLAAAAVTGAAFAMAAAPTAASQELSSVAIQQLSGGTWSFRGNGVLINDGTPGASRHVLTTRQLADSFSLPDVRIVAGTCDLTNPIGTQVANVASFVTGTTPPPPTGSFPNDIALLELAGPIVFGPTVQPARLPDDNFDSYAGESAKVAGWWAVSPCSNIISQTCQSLTMSVITTSEANTLFSPLPSAMIWDSHLCLYDHSTAVTPSKGSVGSGVFVTDCAGESVLVGLVSWGAIMEPGCPNPSFPAVTTRVSAYLEWIYFNLGFPASASPGTSMGIHSCTPCGCTCMRLTSSGQLPQIPNPNFELRVTNMPELFGSPAALLFIGVGPITGGVNKFCGKFYAPLGVGFTNFGSGTPVLVSPCNHEMYWSLPIPAWLNYAAGTTLTAQAVVLCDSGNGLTNPWQFTLFN